MLLNNKYISPNFQLYNKTMHITVNAHNIQHVFTVDTIKLHCVFALHPCRRNSIIYISHTIRAINQTGPSEPPFCTPVKKNSINGTTYVWYISSVFKGIVPILSYIALPWAHLTVYLKMLAWGS